MLAERGAARGWRWTALRPHVIIGPARRSPQNLIAGIGVYASLMKEWGDALSFPGPEAAFDVIYQATAASILSSAIDWAGATPAAHGEAFNITNGEFFRWRDVWPRIAEVFDMTPAGPRPMSLTKSFTDAGPKWELLVAKRGLVRNSLTQLVSWSFIDYVFNTTWDIMSDTLKCRRAGFLEFVDSEAFLVEQLKALRTDKVVP